MEIPVVECVETVFAIVQKIHTTVENVKSFKKRAKRLESRVSNILVPTKALYNQGKERFSTTSNTYQHALLDLSSCLHEIEVFLLELSTLGKIKLFLRSEDIREQFDDFTNTLNHLSGDMALCMVVDQFIKATKDTFRPSRRTYEDTADEIKDLKEMLNYVTQLEKRMDVTKMSDLNRMYVQDMFTFMKSKGSRLKDLVSKFEDDEDEADDDDLTHLPCQIPEPSQVPETVSKLDLHAGTTNTASGDSNSDVILENFSLLKTYCDEHDMKDVSELLDE